MLKIFDDKLMIRFRTGCLLMAALSIARGSSFLFSKSLLGSMEPLNLLGMRFMLAFLILFVLFSRKVIADIRQDLHVVHASLLLGVVYFLCMAAELYGLKNTTSSICSFLENTAIVMVPVIEAVLSRSLPKLSVMISTAAAFTGIGLIVFVSDGGSGGAGIGKGEGLCIIAALMYAAAIIITDRLSKKHDPMTLGILYVGVMGCLGMIAAFFVETPQLPQTGGQWFSLIALAVLCTCFGFAVQPVAQKPITSETTGIICSLNPLTTAVLGWWLLDETLGIGGIIGSLLIIGGIILPNCRISFLKSDYNTGYH